MFEHIISPKSSNHGTQGYIEPGASLATYSGTIKVA
jgi:hypothetical protein